MDLRIESVSGEAGTLVLRHPAVTLAGYTGRDRDAVVAHIEELARHGIPAPASVPAYYTMPWQLLCLSEEPVEVGGEETSGEVEPVLIFHDGSWYVTLGSDHTDRAVERESIVRSKRLCPKVIGRTVWPLEEVEDHWDELALRSWVEGTRPYQEGTLKSILPLRDFPLEHLRRGGRDLVLFLGTLPLMTGGFVMAGEFRGELADPVIGRSIKVSYSVEVLNSGDGL